MKNKALEVHEKLKGKIEVKSKVNIQNNDELSLYYSPGVAEPCKEISKDKTLVDKYTLVKNTVAIVSDGSAVLGLGNIGPKAALPVMEGKSMLFSSFADIYAYPLVIDSKSDQDVINFCKMLAPSVGGILLEDIKAPNCINIEEVLIKELDIPVFHDDQHGTAIVTTAALINLQRFTKRNLEGMKVVISGMGAAGSSIARMIKKLGVDEIYGNNILGVVSKSNYEQNDEVVKKLVDDNIIKLANDNVGLADVMKGADIFVGVSAPNIVTKEMVKSMNQDPWIFAMANPNPEISFEDAKEAGALFVGTGRSDYPNQVNNVLAFPGLFKGVLQTGQKIDEDMKYKVAKALASYIDDDELSETYILPNTLDKNVVDIIADVIVRDNDEKNR